MGKIGSLGGGDGIFVDDGGAATHGSVRGSDVTASSESSVSFVVDGGDGSASSVGGVGAGSTTFGTVGAASATGAAGVGSPAAAASRRRASRSISPLFSVRRVIAVHCLVALSLAVGKRVRAR
jgi:hypothetical protein